MVVNNAATPSASFRDHVRRGVSCVGRGAAVLLVLAGCVSGCAAGSTESSCAVGMTSCGGACVDVGSSATHCGGCDRPCAPGALCCAGACTAQSNDDCGACGQACAEATTCVEGRCAACDQDDRCGPSCAACAAPTPHCLAARCAECVTDAHCAPGQFCDTASAAGACAACDRDDHCGPSCQGCSADTYCDGQACVTCSSHSECPAGKYCNGTACRVCDTSEFCGRNCERCTGSAKPHCNAAGTACAQCGEDSHCKAGEFCNSAGTCEPCTTAARCGPLCTPCGVDAPYCSSTGCAECLDETHCGLGLRCSNGTCLPCDTDDYCGPTCSACTGGPYPFCGATGQDCIECTGDGHCAQGNYCKNDFCAPCKVTDHCGIACVACGGSKPYCNAEGSACVACVVDQHCSGGNFCQGGSCAPCTTDEHCGTSCLTCPADKFCNGASCVGCCGPACAICAPGTYCKSDACASCDTDDHCGSSCAACGSATPHCKGGATCVECVGDEHCPPGSYCKADQCVPCADTARCGPSCVPCAVGETCCGAAAGCANLSSDANNCGVCGKACSTFCNKGLCDASVKCSVLLGGDIWSTPAVDSAGNAYALTTDGKLWRISPACTVDWKYSLGDYATSAPVLSNDEQTVYYGSSEGPARIVAISAANGTKIWEHTVSNGWSDYNTPSVAADGTVYGVGNFYMAGDYHEVLYAFSPGGALLWQYDLGGTGSRNTKTGSPAIGSDGTLFSLTTLGQVHAVTPAGQKRWSVDLGGCCVEDFNLGLAPDGHVYAAGPTNELFKLHKDTGAVLWQRALGTAPKHAAAAVSADGRVFVALGNGRIKSFASDGQAQLDLAPSGCYHNALAIGSDGVLYAVNGCDGSARALAPDTGATLWSLQVANAFISSPNLSADGILWVGANKKMWAVTTGAVTGLASGGWPKRHGGRHNAGRR